MSSPLWKLFAASAAVVFVTCGSASAQICGDADNSGSVTVTDGVQALRAAAALASTCTASLCDIDGSGSITVTDGVNVLRKAAGIAITESCPPQSVDEQVQTLLKSTLPVFGDLTKLGTGAQAAGTSSGICENVDGDAVFDQETSTIEFSNCQLEGFIYDGSLGVFGDETTLVLSFDLDTTDLATDEFFSLGGDLSFRATDTGSVITGNLDASFSAFGDVSVAFEEIGTDANGNFVSGSLLLDASTSDIEGVTGIRVGFATTTVVPVSVFFSDQTERDFTFDTVSGDLTPVSN